MSQWATINVGVNACMVCGSALLQSVTQTMYDCVTKFMLCHDEECGKIHFFVFFSFTK